MISTIRFGFATNSSSTHSPIILKDKKCDIEKIKSVYYEKTNGGDFGWDWFFLNNEKIKLRYFAILFSNYLQSNIGLPEVDSLTLVNSLLGSDARDEDYIDHESLNFIPKMLGTTYEKKKIFNDIVSFFKELAANEDCVIFGGNDNEYELIGQYCAETYGENPFLKSYYNQYLRNKGDYTLWYNKIDGNKIRIGKKVRPNFPELLDVKITDYCEFGCNFCYQGSTKNGKHATEKRLKKFLREMASAGVVEIVLGGGDPTFFPNLIEIVSDFKNNSKYGDSTLISLSTKNKAWLVEYEKKTDWKNRPFSAIAFSTNSVEEALEVKELTKGIGVSFHYVVGASPEENYKEFLEKVKAPIVLLGFKEVGRGKNFKKFEFNWIDSFKKLLKKRSLFRTSIDAVLAEKLRKSKNIDDYVAVSVADEEGEYSAYVDLVNGDFAKHSYGAKKFSFKSNRGNSLKYYTMSKIWNEEIINE